jgi:hypothetical protein
MAKKQSEEELRKQREIEAEKHELEEEKRRKKEREKKKKDKEKREKLKAKILKKREKREQKRMDKIVNFPFKVHFHVTLLILCLFFIVIYFGIQTELYDSLYYSFWMFTIIYLGLGLVMGGYYYIKSEEVRQELEEEIALAKVELEAEEERQKQEIEDKKKEDEELLKEQAQFSSQLKLEMRNEKDMVGQASPIQENADTLQAEVTDQTTDSIPVPGEVEPAITDLEEEENALMMDDEPNDDFDLASAEEEAALKEAMLAEDILGPDYSPEELKAMEEAYKNDAEGNI